MTANDSTPPSGECVSDEQFHEQQHLNECVASDIGYAHDVLAQALSGGKSLQERRVAVKKARQQLELTEIILDEIGNQTESESKSASD